MSSVLRAVLMVAIAAAVIVPCMLIPTTTVWPSIDEADLGLRRKFNLDPALPNRSRPDPEAPIVALPPQFHPVYAIALVEGRMWIGFEDMATGKLVWIEEERIRRPPDPR